MDQLTDEELVAAYRGDTRSLSGQAHLNELFRRHHQRVALWCYRLTGDREWASDLAQEVFLKAFRSLDAFRGDAKFSTWLYTIARNHCFNELKARSVRPEGSGDELPLDLAAPGEDACARLERQSSLRMLHEMMREHLSEVETKVMTLHYAEEMPLESISRLLRLENASGAKAYIVSARRKLDRVVGRWRGRQAAGA